MLIIFLRIRESRGKFKTTFLFSILYFDKHKSYFDKKVKVKIERSVSFQTQKNLMPIEELAKCPRIQFNQRINIRNLNFYIYDEVGTKYTGRLTA